MATQTYGVTSADVQIEVPEYQITASSVPTTAQVTLYITQVAGDVGGYLLGAGIDPDTITTTAEYSYEFARRAVVLGVAAWICRSKHDDVGLERSAVMQRLYERQIQELLEHVGRALGADYSANEDADGGRVHTDTTLNRYPKYTGPISSLF